MPGTFVFLKEEFQIDGVWGGIDLDASLRQLRAGIGSGGSTASEAAFAALGATTVELSPVIVEQCEAVRTVVRTDTGVWTATLDLTSREVIFLNEDTGEFETRAVRPEAGEEPAGSFSLELMGIPPVETPRGNVTIESVLVLLYLQQHQAGRELFGSVKNQDLQVTLEVCFGVLDEEAARLKAETKAAASKETRTKTALRKAIEQRLEYELPTPFDLDMQQETYAKTADHWADERLYLADAISHHRGVLTLREKEAAAGRKTVADAGGAADRAQRALAPVYERRALANRAQAEAEVAARGRTHCPDCEQLLRDLSGAGPLCPLCRQPDPGLPTRQAARDEQLRKAKAASVAAEKDLRDLQEAAQKGIEARRKAEGESERLAGRAEAYRAKEITPREKALAQAAAAETEARARLAEVKDRRKELVRIGELEKLAGSLSKRADEAAKEWAAAEGDSQEHRRQTAKWLSQIFADLLIPMAPDKIRTAVIEPKTFAPKINNRSMKQLARSAGLVSLAHTAYHLMCLEAARTMPLVRLPATQWLDAPFDGLGGGPEGDRLANAALKVCAATAGDDAQIILTTPQVLPASTTGLLVTEHESTRPLIPHARPESEES
ncbi:hypothetical protein RCO28_21925 [Streptomyces sp. LHD-70]|uniref:hypothetical protein n=1 Tax=Streptomyces sp. LHD-70 TaxID=3072140 RepID=UPI00280FAB5E|nr:hypothetical protein [Streptomyces sp. LHD-70]MDQ8705132.1 hypothetical protein [Streptomyces sp. LHD-70]